MHLIVFGIERMNPGTAAMEATDLLLLGNDLTLAPQHPCTTAPIGIAGDGDAGNRGLDAPLRFDGGCDDGIVTEDLLNLVRIGGFAADADAGVSIVWKFWAAQAQ
jgi:hypothetical protein